MGELHGHLLTVFLGFFAIMNPIANTAVFVGLAGEEPKEKQKKIAFKALIISCIVVASFALAGKAIFQLFGITLSALRITGGILVFVIGYQMLHGVTSSLHKGQDGGDADIAVSPLAVPLLAGPGTIATAMSYSADGLASILITIIGFATLCLVTYYCFINAQRILTLIGKSGLDIITRLMGLILAVIGTQMLIIGIMTVVHTQS